jgi:hypothetical protein
MIYLYDICLCRESIPRTRQYLILIKQLLSMEGCSLAGTSPSLYIYMGAYTYT